MKSSAVISECGRFRYRLSRTWDETKPDALFIMLNPSTADATADDPTIRKCIRFARSWGYGGIVVVNLFAFRATDPADLKRHGFPMGPHNFTNVLGAIQDEPKPGIVLCAWGAHKLPPMGNEMVCRIRGTGRELHCLRLTKDGHPWHPLYVPNATEALPFKREARP